MRFEFPEQIESIEDALKLIRKIRFDVKNGSTNQFYNHGTLNPRSLFTDIWFRGESDHYQIPLTPKLFRKQYDETTIFNYLPTYVSELREISFDFDRLCYMQHYGVPTRLLDWTDSILIALYFAVNQNPKKDGKLFVLNSRLLNKHTGLRKGHKNVLNKDNLGSIFRSLMTNSDTIAEWRDKYLNVVKFEWTRKDLNLGPFDLLELEQEVCQKYPEQGILIFCTPASIRPDRTNSRILQQGGLFTIHGGKNLSTDPELKQSDCIPKPYSLHELNQKGNFLLEFNVPAKAKRKIKEDLLYLQIHQGKVFPELEKQEELIDLIGLGNQE